MARSLTRHLPHPRNLPVKHTPRQASFSEAKTPALAGVFIPDRDFFLDAFPKKAIILPSGNLGTGMQFDTKEIGKIISTTPKNLGVTQRDLAFTSGTGLRFIIKLEKGKSTCQFGKVLTVLQTLGIKITLDPPITTKSDDHS